MHTVRYVIKFLHVSLFRQHFCSSKLEDRQKKVQIFLQIILTTDRYSYLLLGNLCFKFSSSEEQCLNQLSATVVPRK